MERPTMTEAAQELRDILDCIRARQKAENRVKEALAAGEPR